MMSLILTSTISCARTDIKTIEAHSAQLFLSDSADNLEVQQEVQQEVYQEVAEEEELEVQQALASQETFASSLAERPGAGCSC